MKELVVIYWSGTGNTESMANAVAEGARIDDVNVKLMNVSEAKVEDIENADAVGLGCPSMGAEQLEESEMEPFVDSISSAIKGKKPSSIWFLWLGKWRMDGRLGRKNDRLWSKYS